MASVLSEEERKDVLEKFENHCRQNLGLVCRAQYQFGYSVEVELKHPSPPVPSSRTTAKPEVLGYIHYTAFYQGTRVTIRSNVPGPEDFSSHISLARFLKMDKDELQRMIRYLVQKQEEYVKAHTAYREAELLREEAAKWLKRASW